MGRHRVKQAALAEAAGLRYATLNALYNGRSKGVDFDTLASILDGLRTLTGQTYTVADLLEYQPAGEVELLATSASDLREQLADLEADTPPQELSAWSTAFESKGA